MIDRILAELLLGRFNMESPVRKTFIHGSILCAACVLAAAAYASDVYVPQLSDRSPRASVAARAIAAQPKSSAYVRQLPESARPVAPRVPVRSTASQQNAPKAAAAVAAPAKPPYPDVGAGVSLALASRTAGTQFPSVHDGVVRR